MYSASNGNRWKLMQDGSSLVDRAFNLIISPSMYLIMTAMRILLSLLPTRGHLSRRFSVSSFHVASSIIISFKSSVIKVAYVKFCIATNYRSNTALRRPPALVLSNHSLSSRKFNHNHFLQPSFASYDQPSKQYSTFPLGYPRSPQ